MLTLPAQLNVEILEDFRDAGARDGVRWAKAHPITNPEPRPDDLIVPEKLYLQASRRIAKKHLITLFDKDALAYARPSYSANFRDSLKFVWGQKELFDVR